MGVFSLLRSCQLPVTTISAIRCTKAHHVLQPLKVTSVGTSQLRQFVTSKALSSGGGGAKVFVITPSRYSWNKYKDSLHFYVMLGLIPGLFVVFCVNVFIGPPTLKPIPAGYTPKEYEYHRHPITRFLAHYFFTGHQEDYERNLFYFAESEEIRRMRVLDRRVDELMAYRGDYPNYYSAQFVMAKYFRAATQTTDQLIRNTGQSFTDTSNPGDY